MSRPTSSESAAAVWIAAGALLAAETSFAYPEGAPWGAANPAAAETCGDCHYDYEPVTDSPALTIDGLPTQAEAGASYDFVIRFAAAEAVIAGFQIVAEATGGDAGSFGTDDEDVESIGDSSRSVAPRRAGGEVAWSLTWRAPATNADSVAFFVAASSANDDQSPFGDRIHYRQLRLPVADDRGD